MTHAKNNNTIHSQPFGPTDLLPGHCPHCNASTITVKMGWVCCKVCGARLYPTEATR